MEMITTSNEGDNDDDEEHDDEEDDDDDEDGEDEDNELDTSRDEDDGELVIEDDAVVEENEDSDDKETAPSKIYNCVDCTRMFMSAEAHANHLREVHGGEGGSMVLKLPTEKKAEKDDATTEDKADDELVIDDSQ